MMSGAHRIKFKVNGVQHSVGCEVDSQVTLLDYLREYLEYRGTKYMCREAGCGACTIAVVKCPGGPTVSVNACMISITSCQDWEIKTIEDLGNRKKGYNILQKTLAEYNGTQCGYCTPAWIMNMYSLLQNGNKPTMLEIEKAFGGNVCRCTGYRPILDAFKTFGRDAPNKNQINDIEDLKVCKKNCAPCKKSTCDEDDWCLLDVADKIIEIPLKDNKCWFKVCDLSSTFQILDRTGYDSYMLVFGNTAKGAYPIEEYPNVLIDISSVAELKTVEYDQNLVVGAGLTLTELLNTFETNAQEEYFGYLEKLSEHLRLVAHIAVRNLGSVGGNLMIKHQHNDFASDIFLLFETVGAYLTIVNCKGVTENLSMTQFLIEDMRGKVIVNALLPPLSDEFKLFTYKVMPRSQNAHAIVNCGYLYKLSSSNKVMEARIVYGGLSPSFIRAKNTERFLINKELFTNETLQGALKVLQNEAVITENPPEPSVAYRKHLSLALFYKVLSNFLIGVEQSFIPTFNGVSQGIINLCPKKLLGARYISEGTKIRETRPLSQGTQVYDTNPSLWPLNQPIPKVEALIQCAGETKYTDDLPTLPHEVHATLVLSTVARGEIVSIDSSRALKEPGVLAFYTAKDIPGLNSFIPVSNFLFIRDEEVLSSGKIEYIDQPYGIIVAETRYISEKAAKMVTATYENVKDPVIDVKDAVKDPSRVLSSGKSEPTDRGKDVFKVIKGENTIYGQYHFMLENIGCVTKPTEEGLEVHLTSHWMDGTQVMISKALKIDENRIDVYVRRLGGSFGFKISRPIRTAIASSLVTTRLNRPCRIVIPLTTMTRSFGKRLTCHTEFECEVNKSGVIQYVDYKLYEDQGFKTTEDFAVNSVNTFNNCYNLARWNYKLYDAVTDNAKNTWCRAPGSLENIAMAENLLERISYELGLDSFDVRIANLDTTKYNGLKEMAENLKQTTSYLERKAFVNEFNAKNRWRKRGLRFSFLRWYCFANLILDINLTVFHADGTVIITHGGIEMGQGINTKAVQIAAYFLKIPINKIQVKGNNTIIAPNGYVTGGSIGSQDVGIGVRRCCQKLLARLEPIRNQMNNPTWEELIIQAFASDVDLQVHDYVGAKDYFSYDVYGVAQLETEVDILTGESQILRVDIAQDVGQSVSPEIDVGQIEGAFVMGLGYWTSENLVYDSKTGKLLSDRTWNYYVPLATDIPQDFRINFRKNSYGFPELLGAKGIGEPPICLSVVVTFALREAIASAREDAGIPKTKWFHIDGPFTVEKIALAAASKIEDFKLY